MESGNQRNTKRANLQRHLWSGTQNLFKMMTNISSPTITQCQSNGQLQVIFGPMFSGKTTELIRRMKRFQIANYDCLIIKYAKDVRYDKNGVATHDSQTLPARCATSLMMLYNDALNADVIGVDEGQFFPDVVEFCEKLANNGKIVIVAGLDATYQRKAFDGMLGLVPLAESVMKLTAVCMLCYGEASFTKRKGSETQLEVIGGADKYLAVCRSCYDQSPTKSPRPERMTSVTDIPSSVGRQLFNSPAKNNAMQIS